MRQFKAVFNFEFNQLVRKKAFVMSSLIICALIILAAAIPSLMVTVRGGGGEKLRTERTEQLAQEPIDRSDVGVFYAEGQDEISQSLSFVQGAKVYEDQKAMEADILSEAITKGFVFEDPTHLRLLVKDANGPFHDARYVDEIRRRHLPKAYEAAGLDPQAVAKAEDFEIFVAQESLGKSSGLSFAAGFVGMFIVYFMILLYGAMVATTVAREKDDRTMELLITTTKASRLIWGKVMAVTLASAMQMTLFLGTVVLAFQMNKSLLPEGLVKAVLEDVGLSGVLVFFLFAVVGAFLYYFVYASLGALVSKVEDVNASTAPIQMIFIGGYVATSTGIYHPNGALMRFLSIFPLTSPLAMFARYVSSTVGIFELILAVVLLLLTTLFLAWVAIKLYRMGSLFYGNRLKFGAALKMLTQKED